MRCGDGRSTETKSRRRPAGKLTGVLPTVTSTCRDPIVPVTRSGAITRTVVCTGCDVTSAPPPAGGLPVRAARRSPARNTSSCGLSASAAKAVVVIPVAFASLTFPPSIETRSGNEPATAAGSSVARAASTRLPGLNPAQMMRRGAKPRRRLRAVCGRDVGQRRSDREVVVARLRDDEPLRGGDGERRSPRVDRDPDARRRVDVVAHAFRGRRRSRAERAASPRAQRAGTGARRGAAAPPTRPLGRRAATSASADRAHASSNLIDRAARSSRADRPGPARTSCRGSARSRRRRRRRLRGCAG